MKHKNIITFCFSTLLIVGCITTKGIKNNTVKEAILLQNVILKDPLFSKILLELEAEKKIDWQLGSLRHIREDIKQYKSKTDWALAKFKIAGPYAKDSVFLKRKKDPASVTTAETWPCKNYTTLNKWKLKRDKYSILNTLIHERIHSFCMIHPIKQTRSYNKCDIAYVAGDLAEIIMLYRAGIKERRMQKPVCPALLDKIKKYNLIKITD